MPDSEAQPDVVPLDWRDDFYGAALPGSADVALLIEVAQSSLRDDRHVKGAVANTRRQHRLLVNRDLTVTV